MNILVDDTIIEYRIQDMNQLNEEWLNITKGLLANNRVIEKVIIDDQTFYTDYDLYILQNFKQIGLINILTIDKSEAIREIINEVKEYSFRLLSHMDQVLQMFYGDFEERHSKLFEQFTEGVNWLHDTLLLLKEELPRIKVCSDDLTIVITQVIEEFEKNILLMENSLQQEDMVLTGDIIQYELQPTIEKLLNGLDARN